MSDKSRTRTFWSGTKGCNAARVAAKRRQDELRARMASERIQSQYKELKGRADQSDIRTQAKREATPEGKA
jgi:hypothetical protein